MPANSQKKKNTHTHLKLIKIILWSQEINLVAVNSPHSLTSGQLCTQNHPWLKSAGFVGFLWSDLIAASSDNFAL